MSKNNVFIGVKRDLALYRGDDIIGFTFTFLDEDGAAYSFSGYTDINLRIYQDADRDNLLKTLLTGDFGIVSNVVTWDTDYSASIGLEKGEYHYEFTYEDSSSRPITLSFGSLSII